MYLIKATGCLSEEPLGDGLRDVKDGAQMVVLAATQHYREARQRVAELTKLAEDLRKFISQEFNHSLLRSILP